ncbi:MAG TPA: VOC family protein [Polyangiaceae bacterium]|nr:VOC family protein [Polyangiaceae bacterium]
MANELNHLIVHCHDRHVTAGFLARLLAAPPPKDIWAFTQFRTSNGVDIDFADGLLGKADIDMSHIAFLVTEQEFDDIFGRIREESIRYWADPTRNREGEINRNDGGRGVYVLDPGGTVAIEFITRPYAG